MDRAVRDLLQEAEERALQVIRCSRARLDRLIADLEREETLDRAQIEACLGPRDGLPADSSAGGGAAVVDPDRPAEAKALERGARGRRRTGRDLA